MIKKSRWQALVQQARSMSECSIESLQNEDRFEHLFKQACGISIDFSKNKIEQANLDQLIQLAKDGDLNASIKKMFAGERINTTEDRPVLHTLLRSEKSDHAQFDEVLTERAKAAEFADRIRSQSVLGSTGKPIDTLVNIGIGGSDLGPQLLIDAFGERIEPSLKVLFLSDVDPDRIAEVLSTISLETTLFILCSKSFTTWETQVNARQAIHALDAKLGAGNWNRHFAGVAVDGEAMTRFGILKDYQFKIWDWVGGRYSIGSSINLICRIALGNPVVDQFLAGAQSMDEHFQTAEFESNLPVILALIQIWNINFLDHAVFITLPYKHALKRFPDYQQQLEMESNGKRVDREGNVLPFATCPYLFGQLGLNAQHAFMQLVHQSQHLSYVEFITVPEKSVAFEEDVAFRSCLAQSRALMLGTHPENNHKACPGNRPSTTLILDGFSPERLGALVALYEHKVFVQSVIWNINAFDQFGVELGKVIAQSLTKDSVDDGAVDVSTRQLIKRFSGQ